MSDTVRNGRRIKNSGKTTWLISFTDVITLMLTFFVLLFSMSTPKQEDWSMATGALNAAFKSNFGNSGQAGLDLSEFNIDSIDASAGLNLDYLASLLGNLFKDKKRFEGVVVTALPESIVVSLPSEVIYAPGDATLTEEGEKAIYSIGSVLKRIDNKIEVDGHTDPTPIQTAEFPSNWELSLARAQSVATKLYTFGYQHGISVQGFADTRYDDLAQDFPEAFKNDIARRVDIIIQQETNE